MIQLTPHMRIFAAIEPMDFRKRLDGTVGVCRSQYQRDPYDGSVYVFRNRRKTMIRLYCFDGLVEWGCDLRIAEGKFPFWPSSKEELKAVKAHEFYLLIRGGNPDAIEFREDWKKIG